jgi:hypothetical protein
MPDSIQMYDTMGRRPDGPPPENLYLVPYAFMENNTLRIGTANFSRVWRQHQEASGTAHGIT